VVDYELAGWECQNVRELMNISSDLYLDAVSQTRMGEWSRGRVALAGDACTAKQGCIST
jgi:2-polyprenyl-6-methoxyphenol hydroxylase-like FAD-dependent oxidoreductase